ncbi:MAG: type I-E CRISPR-associated protein Cas7/Cse4/CasC [Eubacterium sp.]|nr:type I-E CRISPR-associated protein Cas7/Cse4/CasC [Eubacterium sp.]
MNNHRLYLDIHAIQTLPPSNVNRDDSGSPKTAQYGGVQRARVSSQAWKRAIRQYFADHCGANLGVRTKRIVDYVAEQIRALDPSVEEEMAMNLAEETLNNAGIKTDKKERAAKALFFLGKKQATELAEAALKKETDKKILQSILNKDPDIDIALFGRMVADDPTLNEDASAQVAHAISTHAVQTEFDYYTAMDDKAPEDQAGAGMLGTIEYNSETLYRYANVAVHELVHQLGDKENAVSALKLFVEAFSNSMPSGKINTFANDTLPQALMVNIRADRPVSLVSAYEKPVKSHNGYVEESVKRLFQELEKTGKFVEKPLCTLYLVQGEFSEKPEGKEEDNLRDLLNDLNQIGDWM